MFCVVLSMFVLQDSNIFLAQSQRGLLSVSHVSLGG